MYRVSERNTFIDNVIKSLIKRLPGELSDNSEEGSTAVFSFFLIKRSALQQLRHLSCLLLYQVRQPLVKLL